MAYSGELIKRLLVEIDGNPAKLQAALKKAGVDAKVFAIEANRAGKIAGASADAVASKQGNAARAIASATETIARQGKVSGEAAKQLIAQGANAALFFGPQGAIVGAIGIATLAMVGMFTRVKREAAEAASETRKEFAKIAQLDMMGAARRLFQLNQGDQMLREDLASRDPAARDAARQRLRDDFGSVGVLGLQEERKRLQAEMDEIRAGGGRRPGEATGALNSRYVQMREDLEAIIKLLPEVTKQAAFAERRFLQTANEAGGVAKDAFALDAEARAAKAGETLDKTQSEFERRLDETFGNYQERLKAAFEKALVDGFSGTRQEIDAAFAMMTQFAIEHGEQAEIPILKRAHEQAIELLDAITAADKAIREVEEGDFNSQMVASAMRDRKSPAEQEILALEEQRDLQVALYNDESRHAREREVAYKKAQELQGRINALVAANVKEQKAGVRALADQARELGQVIDGVLQLATAWGNVDVGVVNVLRGVNQIATSMPGLLKSFAELELAQEANDPKLLREAWGAIATSALPIMGAIASIGSSIFGDSPADARHREVVQQNTDAIRELTKKAGQLGLGVTGTAAGGAAAGLTAFLANPTRNVSIAETATRDARFWAKEFGLDLNELDKIAKEHGITLDGSITSFQQLQEAIGLTITKLGEFDTTVDSQVAQAEAQIDIFGVTDPLEQLRIRQGARGGRSSALDSVTAGLDLSTAEGREQARKNAEILFQTMMAGGGTLSAGELGGLTGDQLIEALRELTNGLDAIDAAAGIGAAGSSSGTIVGLRSLTEATGSRLEDRFRSLDVKASAAQETRVAMLGALMQIANAVLPVPAIPSGFALARAQQSGAAGAGGAPTFIIESIVIQMPVTLGATDPGQMLSAVQDGMEAAINEAVYRATVREQRIRGDLRMNR